MTNPGISVANIVDHMDEVTLTTLLGEECVGVIKALNSSISIAELRQAAKAIYGDNNAKAIRDDLIRNTLISALPLEKAEELCQKLNIPPHDDVYKCLKEIRFGQNPHKDQSLLSFFGVVEPSSSQNSNSISSSSSTVLMEPCYGLFEYQRDVVLKALKALSEKPHKILLHMPTGSGKTRTSIHIIVHYLLNYEPTVVCWLASSGELLEQAAEELEYSWKMLGNRTIPNSRFWGNYEVDLNNLRDGVLVAGFQKLHSVYKKNQNTIAALGDRVSLMVVDEAHQAIAPTYRSLIEILSTKRPTNALIGLTATPGRTWNDMQKDKELSDFFGGRKVTLATSNNRNPVEFLIAEGYLARPHFENLKFNHTTLLESDTIDNQGDISQEALDALAINTKRNVMIVSKIEALLTRHKRIIVFAASVYHAYLLSAILTAKGYESKAITSETPQDKRQRIIKRFRGADPNPMILCNYGVLTTGFDAPKTSAVVIARPTRSLVLYSQMVGRAIRGPKAGGNSEAEIITIVDTALPGFGSVAESFSNWEDVWHEYE